MKNKVLLSVVILALANASFAQNTLWQGMVDNDFANAGNWNNGVPTSSHIATIRAGASTTLSGTGTANHLRVGQITPAGSTTTVNFETGSAFTALTRIDLGYSLASDSGVSSGTLNVNGGTHTTSELRVGSKAQSGNANNTSGNLVINGGTFNVMGNLWLGETSDSSVGSSSGVVTVNGGVLEHTSGSFHIGRAGSGTLHINGGNVNLAGGLSLSHLATGSSVLRLSSGRLTTTGGFFDWGAGFANMEFEISRGTMVLDGNRVNKLDQYFGDDGTNGLASVSVTGGLMDDDAFSSVYTEELREHAIGGYLLRYGHDGAGTTAVWAVIPESSNLGIFVWALLVVGLSHFRRRNRRA